MGTPNDVREGVFVARIAGRNSWFAWFVGLVCAAVLGALIYLAAPMGPAVGDWTVRTIATGLEQLSGTPKTPPTDGQAQPETPISGPVVPASCEGLFSAEQNRQLVGDAQATMTVGAGEALIGVPGIAELLGAVPALDCRWVTPTGGSAQAVVATVSEGAATTADEMLRALGFDCTALDDGVQCVRSSDATAEAAGSVETHVVRGTVWVASVTTGWQPDGFAEAVDAAVWPRA